MSYDYKVEIEKSIKKIQEEMKSIDFILQNISIKESKENKNEGNVFNLQMFLYHYGIFLKNKFY
jgi:K+/H+ antiporter YhaU regulatory subunit KhtT